MKMSAMNRAVKCVCGNDILMTVGGDESKNTPDAKRWDMKVEVVLMKEPQMCCDFRLDMAVNNMVMGVQLFSNHYKLEGIKSFADLEEIQQAPCGAHGFHRIIGVVE